LLAYTSIGGNLSIGINASLTDISGLINLTSIGENSGISIQSNDILSSLYGLDNIEASSIDGLMITNNPMLSTCEVQSICDYLVNQTGSLWLSGNATGCNSKEEVVDACETVAVQEVLSAHNITISPNPAYDEVKIAMMNDISIDEVNIYNHLGQRLIHQHSQQENIDVSGLSEGLYIVEVLSGGLFMREKLIVR
jgi:hypothetical protein